MQTYKINTQEEMEQFKDDLGFNVDGNLEVNCTLDFKGRLLVKGYLLIKAGYSIKAGGWIEAGSWIEAGIWIKAGSWIEAGDSIEAGYSIKAGGSIEAGDSIEAGSWIEAGDWIKAGSWIEAGSSYGISAGLQITCKGILKYGLKCFAGVCVWREITDEEKTITCGKHEGGRIEYGILCETGLEESKITECVIKGKTYKVKILEEC